MHRESLYQSRSHPVGIELRRFCGIVQVTWLSSECSGAAIASGRFAEKSWTR